MVCLPGSKSSSAFFNLSRIQNFDPLHWWSNLYQFDFNHSLHSQIWRSQTQHHTQVEVQLRWNQIGNSTIVATTSRLCFSLLLLSAPLLYLLYVSISLSSLHSKEYSLLLQVSNCWISEWLCLFAAVENSVTKTL